MRSHTIGTGAALLAAVLALGACAQPDGNGEPDGAGQPSATAPPTTGPPTAGPPTGAPSQPPPMTPPSGQRIVTITGEVEPGVEAGCQILRQSDGPDYLLIVAGGEVRTGGPTTVRGYPDPNLMTFCQQGTPFVVLEVME